MAFMFAMFCLNTDWFAHKTVRLAEKVTPYNKLRGGVTFIEKVPRSPSGKILRSPLRDEALRKLNSRSKL